MTSRTRFVLEDNFPKASKMTSHPLLYGRTKMNFEEFDRLYTELYDEYLLPIDEKRVSFSPSITVGMSRSVGEMMDVDGERVQKGTEDRHFGDGDVVVILLEDMGRLAVVHETATRDDVKSAMEFLSGIKLEPSRGT